jgi:hypothetical protein
MNILQGAQRMKVAGKWMAVAFLSLGVLARIVESIPSLVSRGQISGGIGLFDIILLAAPGACLWLFGWILEGFADRSQ